MRTVVVWDVGGTLVDRAMPLEAFLDRCLSLVGLSFKALPPEAIQAAGAVRKRQEATWRTPADEEAGNLEVAAELLRGTGASDEQIRVVGGAMGQYFDLYALVPGIRRLLSELGRLGALQGVVSNWPPSLRAFLDHHDPARHFHAVVGSGERAAAKPAPAIFRRALERLGVPPSACVYIGDTPEHDIAPARELGMEAIHFDPQRRWAKADARDARELRSLLSRKLRLPAAEAGP